MKDAHGYQLTGCNGEAQALLDQALAQFAACTPPRWQPPRPRCRPRLNW